MKLLRARSFDVKATARKLALRVSRPEEPFYRSLQRLFLALGEVRSVIVEARSARIPFDDIHDRAQWRSLLAAHRCRPWRVDAERDVAGAAGLVIELLLTDARGMFAQALSAGPDGPFARWVLERDLSPRAREHVRAAFAEPPGDRVRQFYESELRQRHSNPLALTPRGRVAHLHWLLDGYRRRTRRLEAHHIAWYALAAAEDETSGVIPTYLLDPVWQDEVPDGLGSGYARLRQWVQREHGIADLPAEAPAHYRETVALGQAEWKTLERGVRVEGVNVIGAPGWATGLGVAARNTIRALEGAGLLVSQRCLMEPRPKPPLLGLECHPVSLVCLPPGPDTETCYRDHALWPRHGVHRIAVWYWETGNGDPAWRRAGDYLDEIWAPTRFIADCMTSVMRIPVTTISPGIEMPRFAPRGRAHFGLPTDRYLFLFVFDLRSTAERKNPSAVIRAFRMAFAANEPVSLVIKINGSADHVPERDALRDEALRAGVTLIDQHFTPADIYALMDACDVYVSLHRAEGYGLTMAEAMAIGKPVIATGYSGNLDFMNAETARLVGYRLTTLDAEVGPYQRGSSWAEPDLAEAAHWMRWAFEEQDAARAMGARGQQDVVRNASLDAYGARMRRRLDELT